MVKARQFKWRLPLFSAVSAVIVFLPELLFGYGMGVFLYLLLAAPIVTVAVLVVAAFRVRKQTLAVLTMAATYALVMWGLNITADTLNTRGRWFIHATRYKAEVISQPVPSRGSLKHIEWYSDGFPGAGNTVGYLVFDPSDSLMVSGKSGSLPCEVARVTRLEKSWYVVLFYTDSEWDDCGTAPSIHGPSS